MSERPEIAITAGPCAGRRFTVGDGGLRLGRSSSNDIQIPDEGLSRNHCLFECTADGSIRVIDLASANGTFVNGVQTGAEAAPLKPGDTVEVGSSVLRIVMPGEEAPLQPPAGAAAAVDLGLGGGETPQQDAQAAPKPVGGRAKAANALWICAVAAMAAAIAFLLFSSDGRPERESKTPAASAKKAYAPPAFRYERVDADSTHIYRYAAEAGRDRIIKVEFDDFPNENRSDERQARLPEWAESELERIFSSEEWKNLENAYSGPSAVSENALKSWRISAVCNGVAKEVKVENTLEPEGFRRVRESLEALANGSLGLHSVMRSRDELLRSSEHSEQVGDEKWDQRMLADGNAFEAIRSYKLAKNDLASLRSETQSMARLQRKIETAEAFLSANFKEAHAEAERAKGIGDWRAAREKYRKICDIIPDKSDERHSAAHAELVMCERNLEAIEKGSKR